MRRVLFLLLGGVLLALAVPSPAAAGCGLSYAPGAVPGDGCGGAATWVAAALVTTGGVALSLSPLLLNAWLGATGSLPIGDALSAMADPAAPAAPVDAALAAAAAAPAPVPGPAAVAARPRDAAGQFAKKPPKAGEIKAAVLPPGKGSATVPQLPLATGGDAARILAEAAANADTASAARTAAWAKLDRVVRAALGSNPYTRKTFESDSSRLAAVHAVAVSLEGRSDWTLAEAFDRLADIRAAADTFGESLQPLISRSNQLGVAGGLMVDEVLLRGFRPLEAGLDLASHSADAIADGRAHEFDMLRLGSSRSLTLAAEIAQLNAAVAADGPESPALTATRDKLTATHAQLVLAMRHADPATPDGRAILDRVVAVETKGGENAKLTSRRVTIAGASYAAFQGTGAYFRNLFLLSDATNTFLDLDPVLAAHVRDLVNRDKFRYLKAHTRPGSAQPRIQVSEFDPLVGDATPAAPGTMADDGKETG
jgi:hypothetical protein